MVDAFIGRYEVESRDNYNGFMKGVGVKPEYIEAGRDVKVITEISKNGDVITISRQRPKHNSTNSFRLGEETEIDTIKGETAKVTVNVDGNNLVVKGKEYLLVGEIVGEKLKETVTLRGHTMSRLSKRI